MSDNEDLEKKHLIYSEKSSRKNISKYSLKILFVAHGKSLEEISNETDIALSSLQNLCEMEKWEELRNIHIASGLQKIQNRQVNQATKLLDLENKFKELKIIQLEKILESYIAYYDKFGHLFQTDLISGEIIKNDAGIPIKLKIPDVSKEIRDIKESMITGAGVHQILEKIERIVEKSNFVRKDESPDIIDISEYSELFEKSDS